mgnify:CR=1 FL=1
MAAKGKILVIGGGPAGSTVATLLAKAGLPVTLLEKARFPRFHIGESLLPYNRPLFEELGVLKALEAVGFPVKHGAQFHLGNGSKHLKFAFGDGRFTHEPTAFQVERAIFDDVLLKNARANGVEVCEGITVSDFADEDSGVSVAARTDDGEIRNYSGRFLVDATGQINFTGTRDGLREFHPKLQMVSVFGHYSNVHLDEGTRAGDTVIIRDRDRWFWLIPIGSEKVSVGVVADRKEFSSASAPEKYFQQSLDQCREMRERMAVAKLLTPIRTAADFSYCNRRFVGNRLLRVGDAAGFLDPIFSSGVYLAMLSGQLAAVALKQASSNDDRRKKYLTQYENKMRNAFNFYREMVEGFYSLPFLDVFFEPRDFLKIPDAVNAALAGELSGRWALWWRMRMFFWLVRRQTRRPFLPHVSFD